METFPSFILGEDAAGIPDDATESGFAPGQEQPRDGSLLDAYSQSVVNVVDQVGPSVVRLDVRRGDGRRGGSGSGVIVSPDGLILTNSHVIQGARRADVTALDGRSLSGRVLGDDPDTDLALVRVDEDATLPAAKLGELEAVAARRNRHRDRQSARLRFDRHRRRHFGARALAALDQRPHDR